MKQFKKYALFLLPLVWAGYFLVCSVLCLITGKRWISGSFIGLLQKIYSERL